MPAMPSEDFLPKAKKDFLLVWFFVRLVINVNLKETVVSFSRKINTKIIQTSF